MRSWSRDRSWLSAFAVLPRRLVRSHGFQRVLLHHEHVLSHGPISPLAGRRLRVELLVGQPDERADEPRPFCEPLDDEPLHRRSRDPRLIARLEHLAGMDLLVVNVVGDQRPDVLALGAPVRWRHRELTVRRFEQRVHRRHRLLQQFPHRSAHGRCHVSPPVRWSVLSPDILLTSSRSDGRRGPWSLTAASRSAWRAGWTPTAWRHARRREEMAPGPASAPAASQHFACFL